ncbi:sulfotransferase [Litoricolaceae bacterium]|nr:sulfotransferase [Litorivicinaceae bacterium]
MSTLELFERANKLLKAGKLGEARELYEQVLKNNPKHPEASHNIGVTLVSLGLIKESISYFQIAVEQKPQSGDFWFSLIVTLIRLHDLAKARELLIRDAVVLAIPDEKFGKLFRELRRVISSGSVAEMRDRSVKTRDTKSQDPVVLKNRDTATLKDLMESLHDAHEKGLHVEVEALSNKVLKIHKENSIAYCCLAIAMKNQLRFEEALTVLKNGLNICKEKSDILANLGSIYLELEDYAKAVECLNLALKDTRHRGIVINDYGRALTACKAYSEAEDALNEARYLLPKEHKVLSNLGFLYSEMSEWDKALSALQKAIDLQDDDASTWQNLFNIYSVLGRQGEANDALERAMACSYVPPEIYRIFANTRKFRDPKDPTLAVMESLYRENTLSPRETSAMCFGLAKAYEDLGEYRTAFDFYKKGNSARLRMLDFDFRDELAAFEDYQKIYSENVENQLKLTNEMDRRPKPIFIVAMPRSGTTLLEQVLSAHSDVQGLGELNFVRKFGEKLAVGKTTINQETLETFRNEYLQSVAWDYESQYVIDKMPQNFRFLGLINLAFPDAKIVHVSRDPKAVCWGNFKTPFKEKGLGYSFDLNQTVRYYHLYRQLIAFWKTNFGFSINEICYEDFVKDQDNQTRWLLESLGIPFEKACMTPEENQREIRTASLRQVRSKVYQGSSEQWKKYEQFIGDRFDSLNKYY